MLWKLTISGLAFLIGVGMGVARADDRALGASIRQEIADAYPGARIEITGPVVWFRGEPPANVSAVRFLGENGRGEGQIEIRGLNEDGDVAKSVTAEGMVPFSAMVPAHVAIRRVLPGDKLDPDLFLTKSIDVARGQAREMRGILYPGISSVAGLEARQTILEGQALTSSAVQKMPDLRRGDSVSIHLISGGLTLTVPGTSEEPGYLDGRVRVLSAKTKRELVGKLQPGGIVEVQL
jgi:flagella basal body P-ring formation protein FlgA